MKGRRTVSILLIVCLIISLVPFAVFARTTGVVNGSDGSLNMRSGPGSSYSLVAVLPNGTSVNIISTSGNWYYVNCYVSGTQYIGYVYSGYIKNVTTTSTQPELVDYVPEIYQSYFAPLKAQHPNWQFKFYLSDLEWSDVVAAQTRVGVSAIESSQPVSYRSTSVNYTGASSSYTGYVSSGYVNVSNGVYTVSGTNSLNMRSGPGTSYSIVTAVPNGSTLTYLGTYSCNDGTSTKAWYKVTYSTSGSFTPIEGSSWYQAHGQVVQYYLDPRNFWDERQIFQFEQLAYDSSIHSLYGVQQILSGTFMDGAYITRTDGSSITYAQAFMEAASAYGVSPYHLAARVVQEVGRNGSQAAHGTNANYPGIYNFYSIGANSGMEEGLQWASSTQYTTYWRPWNSPYKSIMGGAQYIASGYIDRGQSSLYLEKFDIIDNSDGLYNHQYMSNIMAPYSEANRVYNAYSNIGILNSSFLFVIPVYKNMPASACRLPAASSSPNTAADYELANKGTLPSVIADTPAAVLNLLENNDGVSVIVTRNGTQIGNNEKIGTGCVIKTVSSGDPTVVYDTATALRYGDIDGNGLVNPSDYQVLKDNAFSGANTIVPDTAYYDAADLTKDGALDAFDCYYLDAFINGTKAPETPVVIKR